MAEPTGCDRRASRPRTLATDRSEHSSSRPSAGTSLPRSFLSETALGFACPSQTQFRAAVRAREFHQRADALRAVSMPLAVVLRQTRHAQRACAVGDGLARHFLPRLKPD